MYWHVLCFTISHIKPSTLKQADAPDAWQLAHPLYPRLSVEATMSRRNLEASNDPLPNPEMSWLRRAACAAWRGMRAFDGAVRWCAGIAEAILAFYGLYWLLTHLH